MTDQTNPYQQILDALLASPNKIMALDINVTTGNLRRGLQKVWKEYCYNTAMATALMDFDSTEALPEFDDYKPVDSLVVRELDDYVGEDTVRVLLSIITGKVASTTKFQTKLQFKVVPPVEEPATTDLNLTDLGDTADGEGT